MHWSKWMVHFRWSIVWAPTQPFFSLKNFLAKVGFEPRSPSWEVGALFITPQAHVQTQTCYRQLFDNILSKTTNKILVGKLPGLVVNVEDSRSEPWSLDVGSNTGFTKKLDGKMDYLIADKSNIKAAKWDKP